MLGGKSRLVRVKEKQGTPSAASPPSLHSHEGDNSSSSMEEYSPRPAASDYHPALAEYLKAYNQQINGTTPGSPGELRRDAIADAIAQVTGDMIPLESSGSATSGGSMSHSSGNAAFDYAYTYGLSEQKVDLGTMARGDSNANYQIPHASQQLGKPGMPPQFRPDQLMDGTSPPYFGGHGSPAQYSRHQSPLSLGNSSPIAATSSNPPLSESSESQSHSPIPPNEAPPLLHSQYSQQPPAKQSYPTPSQQMVATSSTARSAQYYADTLQNPHTPFSAFEPAFMAPRRDGVPNNISVEGNDQNNISLRPLGDLGFPMPPMQLPPLDISTLGQPPDSIDLSWQLMSDLRPYL